MKVTIDAPWTEGKEELDGMLGFIQQSKQQLLYFQKRKDTMHIQRDIRAYDLILESKSEKNATQFLDTKHKGLRTGKRYADNMAVIGYMKSNNLWEGK